ncbi:cobalt ABC transporter, ATP-binding protein [Peptoanaerobacter stomatis]|uniref:Energy-coupling factor transporter ATP-binding protein EcfA2 n=1 Tax=Peptoanaerobacter stomatis TaxID=796937 RepID=J6H7C4_9FIRM|nr:energy-coupling factor transporter ATPase [Peptoanaerobacter stomatis]EJU21110.1 cobalt ABC transporter, ATP-binding protein [Peptoanaerobacter stomatis]NWO26015.1 energy-coupling factor transporter ATPase [Peptostreptococcaceae bacterium oral taxon 081]
MSIKVENLKHIYAPNTPFETIALDDINIEIKTGEFIGLIGHTGSGKSTFIQHLNGLLKSNYGKIFINDLDITDEKISLTDVRKKVGLVFQYPEYQLFEETIEKDIAFGPRNLGLVEDEITQRVKDAMQLVGLEYERSKDKSPFDISGGQKRRVAIAGVIAMKPEILILDEPTAGLDPKGRDDILRNIKEIHEKEKNTIILVSHSMEDVAKLADRLLVMNRGKVEFFDTPKEVFKHEERLKQIGLDVPKVLDLAKKLREQGFDISDDILTIDDIKLEILKNLKEK